MVPPDVSRAAATGARHYANRREAIMSIDIAAVIAKATAEAIGTVLWTSRCFGTVSIDGHEHTSADPQDCDASLHFIGYDAADLAESARKEIEDDVRDFIEANAADITQLIADGKADAGSIGYDFVLTRNHEGAGFWDRGYGEVGDRLTANAHPYGGLNGYVGDDGLVYVAS